VQNPNFFGFIENLENISSIAKKYDSLMIVSSNPISMALFKPPGDYDADIVVSEGQSLGIPTSFGGPYVGIFACKKKYMRQMPGRIVGRTIDSNNRKGFVLTLQTREQHIRREKATSNICTSVALIALTATAYLGALGKNGIRHIAELCYHKAHYAASRIDSIPGFSMALTGTFFNEFVITCPISPKKINSILLDNDIIGGYDVSNLIPNGMLLSFTELNTKEQIDQLVEVLANIKH
jgi:glycine dehydrogenase subunit 1